MQAKSAQKLFVAFLEMPGGGVREVKVKAASSEAAGKRAMKRVQNAIAVRRVEKVV